MLVAFNHIMLFVVLTTKQSSAAKGKANLTNLKNVVCVRHSLNSFYSWFIKPS